MKITNTIGEGGCACGEYQSPNLVVYASCRKSSGSPDSSLGVAHLLRYDAANENGLKELGEIADNMFGYGCDYIRLEKITN